MFCFCRKQFSTARMTDMPTTYETKTTTTTTSTSGGGIGFQPDYIRTIPGILKIVEIVRQEIFLSQFLL